LTSGDEKYLWVFLAAWVLESIRFIECSLTAFYHEGMSLANHLNKNKVTHRKLASAAN
jgi:hypothetical protein